MTTSPHRCARLHVDGRQVRRLRLSRLPRAIGGPPHRRLAALALAVARSGLKATRRAGVVVLAVGALFASVLAGQASGAPGDATATLVANINPAAATGSNPGGFTNVNGTAYFAADDGTNGRELWKSVGTTATMVANINPGPGSSDPAILTNVNGTVFFSADDGTNGRELWKSDGTTTTMVADINPNPGNGSGPSELTNVNGTLYFSADDGTNGIELWKSDGTQSGTTIVEDAVPGGGIRPGPASSNPGVLTNVNGTLYFDANDGTNGNELWKSDGTQSGTTIVEDAIPGGGISPGSFSSVPAFLTNVNGTLYFSADDGTNGVELWKSDGTTATMVANIKPGVASSDPVALTNVNGTLFFRADDGINGRELWKSNGTTATMVANINPGGSSSNPNFLTNVNGTVFFAADNGYTTDLWRSDGTQAGTTEVGHGVTFGFGFLAELTNVNGTLFFSADDGPNGRELWKSDGTQAGTTIVEDAIPGGGISPGATGSYPLQLTNVNGTLFFQADDGTNGGEPWKATIESVDVAPTAVGDTVTVAQDSAATAVDVLANDTDPDGGPKAVASAVQPAHGTVVSTPTGVTYAPAAGYCGADSFTYSLNGGSTATVSVTVTCTVVPPPPDATSPPGFPDTTKPPAVADTTRPSLGSLRLSSRKFRAAKSGPAVSRAKVGTKVSFALSEASSVRFTVQRQARRRNGPKRWVAVKGSFTFAGKAGANSLRFRGRIGGQKLKPGSYRLTAQATDPAKNRSLPSRTTFKTVR